MTDEGAKLIAEAIEKLANSVEILSCKMTVDQTLAEWTAGGLSAIAEQIGTLSNDLKRRTE